MQRIYLVPTDAGTYERHDDMPPPLCDYEGPLCAIPPGWKIVPCEPTDEMVWAGRLAHATECTAEGMIEPMIAAWTAMLDEAPEPPDNAALSSGGPAQSQDSGKVSPPSA